MSNSKLLIFGGSGSGPPAQEIAGQIGPNLFGNAEFTAFRTGQLKWHLPESVRGSECWVIQFFNRKHSDDIVKQFQEAKVLLRTLKDCHAASWNLVMPLLPETRQDQQWGREPYTFFQLAQELVQLGVTEVITYDLHNAATAAYFDGHCTHLYTSHIFLPLLKAEFETFDVVCSADTGSTKMAEWYSRRFGCDAAIIYKGSLHTSGTREIKREEIKLAGDVQGKKVLLVDELCDSGGTLANAINFLIDQKGASQVVVVITHTVGAENCKDYLKQICSRKEVLAYWTTNSVIQQPNFWPDIPKTKVLPLQKNIAESIGNIHGHKSVMGPYRI